MAVTPPQYRWRPLTIAFIGCVAEGRRTLEGLLDMGEEISAVFTFEPAKAATVSGAVPFGDLAEAHGIPLHEVRSINDPDVLATMRALQPDLVFCVGWTQLLGAELLAIPRIGCLGFHASLLPRYRGRAPVNWALINGEPATGNTLMLLDEGVDTGDILAQRVIPITPDDTCGTVYDKVAATELEMIAEVMPLLHLGVVPRRAQDHEQATVMGRRRPDDGLIDWHQPAPRLHDWVRALTHPYPGAFTILGGHRVHVWRAHVDPSAPPGEPGRWQLAADPPRLVAHGTDGAIVIDRVQLAGGDETDGVTFAHRHLPAEGSVAGHDQAPTGAELERVS